MDWRDDHRKSNIHDASDCDTYNGALCRMFKWDGRWTVVVSLIVVGCRRDSRLSVNTQFILGAGALYRQKYIDIGGAQLSWEHQQYTSVRLISEKQPIAEIHME